eukprot:6631373-Alexandrium_andersonii.AAC.1
MRVSNANFLLGGDSPGRVLCALTGRRALTDLLAALPGARAGQALTAYHLVDALSACHTYPMTLLGGDPPPRDLAAIQPRLRPFLTQVQLDEAVSAAFTLQALEGVMGRQADASLAVLQGVMWLLPTEYAGSYMRPSVARLGLSLIHI